MHCSILVGPKLRRIAAFYLRQQRRNHAPQPTALVHEPYVQLLASNLSVANYKIGLNSPAF
jgi:hypothetical protein